MALQELRKAMNGDWKEVVEIYKRDRKAQRTIISKTGYTALHIAVADEKEGIVAELVKVIVKDDKKEGISSEKSPLEIKNARGNTPLHIAAAMGSKSLCNLIIGREKGEMRTSLIQILNKDGETPLFLAALHGKTETFRSLIYLLDAETACKELSVRRKVDGNTVLHCAIDGEYMDLAFEILKHNKNLASFINEEGKSPLHILASKPSVFRSGSKLGIWKYIIYELTIPKNSTAQQANLEKPNGEREGTKRPLQGDPENPSNKDEGNQSAENEAEKNHLVPTNYIVFYNFVVLLIHAVLAFTGLGINNILKLEKKHRWSLRVLDELLESDDKLYTIEDSGGNPTSNEMTEAETDHVIESPGGGVLPDPRTTDQQTETHSNIIKSTTKGEETDETDKTRKGEAKKNWDDLRNVLLDLLKAEEVNNDQKKDTTSAAMLDFDSSNAEEVNNDQKKDTTSAAMLDFDSSNAEEVKNDQKKDTTSAMMLVHDSSNWINLCKTVGLLKAVKPIVEEAAPKKTDSAVLIASKHGITEMVRKIIKKYPMAIYDETDDKKNVVLLALEHRKPEVYKYLQSAHLQNKSVFWKIDSNSNGALHIAAMMKEQQYQAWPIPGDALQLLFEIKWYRFVEQSMPENFFNRYNKDGKTPDVIFREGHKDMVEKGGQWMRSTAESCSVVSTLIATVAFASSTALPGGINDNSGKPVLEQHLGFKVFAVSSLIALSFSVTSLVMFLAILTSRFAQKDFGKALPWKLLIGLTSLFVSIASMLVSFCAGHFFVLGDSLKLAAFPVYALTCIPVSFFAAAQFPLYFDLLFATFGNPFSNNKIISLFTK